MMNTFSSGFKDIKKFEFKDQSTAYKLGYKARVKLDDYHIVHDRNIP